MSDFIKDYAYETLQNMIKEQETTGQMIERLIAEHAPKVKEYIVGQRYYDNDPDIFYQAKPMTPQGRIDEYKPDWRLAANFHANQVDHKVNYLLAEPINYKAKKQELKVIGERLGNKFDDLLIDTLVAASNKGIEWIHTYYDTEGNLKFKQIPAEQVVPVYDEYDNLAFVIRHYILHGAKRAELWTYDGVSYWIEQNKSFVPDYYWGEHETTHHTKGNWDKIPFTPFRNNTQERGDIWRYKDMIDAFNKRLSDLQNTFDESTDLIVVLKGYEGTNLDEFMRNLKHYKAIKVSADGSSGVESLQITIPVAETKEYLQMMRENIVDFGQGVDFTSDKFGNSPSGVALKVLFASLDMKAKALERKTRVALEDILYFVFDDAGIKTDPAQVEMTFQYNRLTNDLEDTQIAVQSRDIISTDTILANHPWVDDPEGEKQRLEEEDFVLDNPLPELDEEDEDGPGDNTKAAQQDNQ